MAKVETNEEGSAEGCNPKQILIDSVNPKLKDLNRPLLIAIPALLFSLALIIGLTVTEMNNCAKNTWIGAGQDAWDALEEIKPNCVNKMQMLLPRRVNGVGYSSPFNMNLAFDGNAMSGYMLIPSNCAYPPHLASKWDLCGDDGGAATVNNPESGFKGQGSCPGWSQIDEKVINVPDPANLPAVITGIPAEGTYTAANYNYRGESAVAVHYETCPSLQVALGAAMGLAATAEAIFVVILLVILRSFGCISIDKAKLKKFLDDL